VRRHPFQRHALAIVEARGKAAERQATQLGGETCKVAGQLPPFVLARVAPVDDRAQVHCDRDPVEARITGER